MGKGNRQQNCTAHVRTASVLLDLVPEERHLDLADLVPSVAVVMWWRARNGRVNADDVSNRFNVNRATAYRWLRALKDHDAEAAAARIPGERSGSPAPMGADDGRALMGGVR